MRLLAALALPLTGALISCAASPPRAAQAVGVPDPLAANAHKLYAEGHPWAKFALDTAASTSGKAAYGDFGQWAALAYVMTEQPKWAQVAAGKLLPLVTREPTNANTVRENFIELALFYGWIKPGLTTEQETNYRNGLNRWCEWCLAIKTKPYNGGFRVTDSDQTLGQYLGLSVCDRLLGTDWCAKADALGARDAVRRYCRQAAGGEWIESSEYNLGTPSLLLTGAYAAGIDRFPEVAAFAPELAKQMVWDLTPDLKASYQWGDEEHPRDLRLFDRIELLAMAAGITGDRDAQAAVTALAGRTPLPKWLFLGWRALYFYQPPSQPAVQHSPAAPYLRVGIGNGQFRYRRGDVLFGAHFPSRLSVDHEVGYFGDFQLYRDGEWVLTHPLGYAGKMVLGEAANSCLLAGLSSMHSRSRSSWKENPDGCRMTGQTSGPYYGQPYYDPPPAFAEWTRTLIYTYPSRVEVRDRFVGHAPERTERYRAADQAKIKAAPALWQQVFHCPAQPVEIPDGYLWKLSSGKTVKLTAPAGCRRLLLKETEVLSGAGSASASELAGYQIRFLSDAPDCTMVAVVELLPD